MATIAAVIGAAATAYGAYSSNKANAAAQKGAKGAGQVDTTTTRTAAPGEQPYIDAGGNAAYNALFGKPSGIYGNPNAAPAATAPKSTGKANSWTDAKGNTVTRNAAGKVVPYTGSGGGGASGGSPAANTPFNGQSQETRDVQARMDALAGQNAGMYGAAENYSKDTLAGNSHNPLMGQATDAANAIAQDPGLADYESVLRGGIAGAGGGATGGSTGGYGGNAYGLAPASYGGGGSYQNNSATSDPTGVAAALRDMIGGKDAPGLAAQAAAIQDEVGRSRAQNIKQLRARAVGSGFYGGDIYQQLEEGAVAQGDQEMTNQLAAARFGAYQNAINQGVTYDSNMADVAARNAATAAGAGSAAASLAQQSQLARLGMWGDALKTGQSGRAGTASALGNLSSLYSNDQQHALAGVNDLGTSRRSDVTAAGQLSLGSDQSRNTFIGNADQLRAAQISGGNQRAALKFQEQQFYDPLTRLSAYSNVLGGLYGGQGSETTKGTDTRSQSPPAYVNPYGAALTGAAVGGQIGTAYQNPYGSSGTYNSRDPNGNFNG